MKISQIISETTNAGSVAPVEHAFVKMRTRNPSVYGSQKVGSLLKGKKTNKPFANSINEGAIKDAETALANHAKSKIDHEKNYGPMTGQDLFRHEQIRKQLLSKKKRAQAAYNKKMDLDEAELSEDDIIMMPGRGNKYKPGFHKIDPDKAEHEGQTLKNSLHTIIRVASELDKQLSVKNEFPEWVSEKIGAIKGMMVSVADYVISAQEMQHGHRKMEGVGGAMASDELMKMSSTANDRDQQNIGGGGVVAGGAQYEGKKVDRMVQHIKQSEKKLGKSSKEAENIAWATANKRGMLDNKNKKK